MAAELTIMVRVIPRSSKSEVVGIVDGNLKVRVAAPPVDGAANAELIKVLSRHFDVARREITIISGETSRIKKVLVGGLDDHQIGAFLKGTL
mgnify:FL=1